MLPTSYSIRQRSIPISVGFDLLTVHANITRAVSVAVLPTEGPKITGGRTEYHIGDTVSVNCTSAKSKPAASLKWFVNDELAGPGYETEYSTTLHADGLETSTLRLRFAVTSRHFHLGSLRLRCTATISQVYTMSNEELVAGGGRRQTSGLLVTENMGQGFIQVEIDDYI
ncbi:hypothetical protein LAZ67_22000629 [Cordylochernes scorpioides]|uniref:Ig-like domain-containing protein n=1 Tax=Cordylochernes scorpioides TaxID=51811 RepID=A0ABY6LPC2_9ARAC|nr:hypothetical protein LAZ67_22000629 [Cordylochernes scorpioides]